MAAEHNPVVGKEASRFCDYLCKGVLAFLFVKDWRWDKRRSDMAAEAEEKLIGRIANYFSHLSVCAIELTDGELKVGDTIHISGKNTDFTQTVGSIQTEHQNINRAEKGKVVGVKVKEKARKHDLVFGV